MRAVLVAIGEFYIGPAGAIPVWPDVGAVVSATVGLREPVHPCEIQFLNPAAAEHEG